MMTSENRQSVIDFLKTKKLPLDLLVEVTDHMTEQIEYVMDHEDFTFDDAFLNVQGKWEKDLKLTFSFYGFNFMPALQRRISNEFQKAVWKKSALIFIPVFIISILLLLTNKTYAYYFILGTFIVLAGVNAYYLIRNYKIVRKISGYKNKGISYLQHGASNFYSFIYFLPLFIFLDYNEKFERFYTSFLQLIHFDLGFNSIFGFFINFALLFYGLAGLFYFLEFKKAVHYLEKRINYKI